MPAGTIPKIAWPMVVETGVNDVIIFDEGGVDITCTLPSGTYFWRGDGSAADMQFVLDTALNAALPAPLLNGYSVSFQNAAVGASSAGTVELDSDNVQFTVQWTDALTTANPLWFGETGLADHVYNTIDDSPNQCSHVWLPEQIYIDDSEDRPYYLAEQQIMGDGSTSAQQWGERFERTIIFDVLPAWKVFEGDEVYVGEAWYQQTAAGSRASTLISQGLRFEFTPSVSVPGTYKTYSPNGQAFMRHQGMATPSGMVRRYDLTLPMIRFV